MNSVTVKIRFKAGHSYTFTYKKDKDLFCPQCGQKEVWVEQGEGDYYFGESHLCISCKHDFTLQGPYEIKEPYDQILTAIKEKT